MSIDTRYLSTPLGGLAGYLLARKLIPKEDRTVFNQTAGTAAGAGLGFMAGGYLNNAIERPDPKDQAANLAYHKKNLFAKGPEDFSDPTQEDIDVLYNALNIKNNKLDTSDPTQLRVFMATRVPAQNYHYARSGQAAYANKAKLETDPIQKALFLQAAKKWGSKADNYKSQVTSKSTTWGAQIGALGDILGIKSSADTE